MGARAISTVAGAAAYIRLAILGWGGAVLLFSNRTRVLAAVVLAGMSAVRALLAARRLPREA